MNKYFDIEDYEINVILNNDDITMIYRHKKSEIDISTRTINKSKSFNINLLHSIICNSFSKKEGYSAIIKKYCNKLSDIIINIKPHDKIDITFNLFYRCSAGYRCSKISEEKLFLYKMYEKTIEEFDDKIILYKYTYEKNKKFETIINHYEKKDIIELEIKPSLNSDYMNIYRILYDDDFFYIKNISYLYKLESLIINYYIYDDLTTFYNETIKYLCIGSLDDRSLIKSLKGISSFKSLTKLKLVKCYLLNDIIEILKNEDNNIKELEILFCNNINLSEIINYCLEKDIKFICTGSCSF